MVTKQDLRNRLLVLPKDWCGDKGEEESSSHAQKNKLL